MKRPVVAIVGVGLIGGSIGLALRKRKLAARVIGIGRKAASLRKAKAVGAVTETTTDLAAGASAADVIIICTPVESVVDFVGRVAAVAAPGALITDVGSTKAAIIAGADGAIAAAAAERTDPRRSPQFVGSHPMAGSEKVGVEHARDDLFIGRTVIVTPSEVTPAGAVKRIRAFWKSLGAKVVTLSPEKHDEAAASISHAPHVVAAALAAATRAEDLPLAAKGWADSTRIAAGDVELWRQILLENRGHTLQALARFEKVLSAFRAALEQNNPQELIRLLEAGKQRRDALAS